MLEKDAGSPRITRLRVIQIYEADFNLIQKIQWSRRLVRTAEQFFVLGTEQYGSRPHRSAQEVAAKKYFTYHLIRLVKAALATFDYDASACYDGIIVPLAMLAA